MAAKLYYKLVKIHLIQLYVIITKGPVLLYQRNRADGNPSTCTQ